MTNVPAHMLRGQQTRDRLMDYAVRVATTEGLEALTIGRLADAAGLAKASVLGHYRSKEQLQLAALEVGSQRFIDHVIVPSAQQPAGILRLVDLLDRWINYVTEAEGGCLFASVAAEFDGRTGVVRDRVKHIVQVWLATLVAQIEQARALDHLRAETDSEQLAFCLHGIELSMNLRQQLLQDERASLSARTAMHLLIREAARPRGKKLLASRAAPVAPDARAGERKARAARKSSQAGVRQ